MPNCGIWLKSGSNRRKWETFKPFYADLIIHWHFQKSMKLWKMNKHRYGTSIFNSYLRLIMQYILQQVCDVFSLAFQGHNTTPHQQTSATKRKIKEAFISLKFYKPCLALILTAMYDVLSWKGLISPVKWTDSRMINTFVGQTVESPSNRCIDLRKEFLTLIISKTPSSKIRLALQKCLTNQLVLIFWCMIFMIFKIIHLTQNKLINIIL